MKILHFVGEGRGFMSGITEYIVFKEDKEDDEIDIDEEIAPGFELKSETEIDDMPSSFPTNTTLIPKY